LFNWLLALKKVVSGIKSALKNQARLKSEIIFDKSRPLIGVEIPESISVQDLYLLRPRDKTNL
jgi:hypothetical protein